MKRLIASVMGASALLALPLSALAQPGDAEAAASGAAAAAVGGFMLLVMAVFGLIGLGFFIFWIMMLVDCAKREWPDKNTWLIVLIVSLLVGFHWLTALMYYFLVKRKNLGGAPVAMTGPAPMPPQPPTPPAPPAPPQS